MSPNAPRPKGRPPKFVKDGKSHEVTGLSALPVRNKSGEIFRFRYYACRSTPRVYFGYDLEPAIDRFRQWQSEQRGDNVDFEVPTNWTENQRATLREALDHPAYAEVGRILDEATPVEVVSIPETVFSDRLNELLRTSKGRRKLARLTGRKQFEYLDELNKPVRPLSLREVGQLFYGERDELGKMLNGKNTNDKQKAWKCWQELSKAVKVANLQDVTRDKLAIYRDFIDSLKLGSRTVKNRFDTIGQILCRARDRRENHTEFIDKFRDSFRIICRKKAPKVAKGIPTPIDVDDFAAMLNVVNVKWKAILYLMLNCGLHPGELTGLTHDDIDLDKRWLWDHRNKTIEQRCSVLWAETIEALRDYLKEYNPDGGLLFVNRAGGRHSTAEFGKEFYRKARNPAKLKSITMEWFRDSGRNAASTRGVDSDKVRMWLGHDRGELDKYDPRHPLKTQPVVDAIYAEYFGSYQPQPQKDLGINPRKNHNFRGKFNPFKEV